MFRTRFRQSILIFILILPFLFINSYSKASDFIPKGYYIIDLRQKIEWLTCPVGMVWQNNTCEGKAIKIKFSQIDEALKQANNQLEGNWRLPSREELENLVCKECKLVKINQKYFPNTPPVCFWTSEKNSWQPQFYWTVNFFTGHTFGRFPGFIPNHVRLVRDR